MVATVRNLTSSSATSEYFLQEGGYYLRKGDDETDLGAKQEEHRNASAWHGRGAAALGLEPGKRVSAGTFEKLLQGHVVGTNTRLGRLRDGQHEHRPGFDITFSAPKSVSLAALLPTEKHPRGDRAVLRAHDEAVRATLDWIEATMLETRGWDPATRRRPRVKAPSMVASLFRHIASRNLDPQLHTHAVVANMTRDAEGMWTSVEPMLLHRNARLIGAYYRDQLARRLIERGYSIVPAMAGRIPSFEIAGYGRRLQEAFSTRRQEILAYVKEKGWVYGEASAQKATFATRKRKAEPLRAMLRTAWADRARQAGLDTIPSVSRSRGPIAHPAGPSALEIVWRTMRHLEERQSVFAERDLEALALGHSPGRHSIEEIREAVEWMVRDGHLVEANLRRSDRAFVTDRALKAERSVIATMKAGIGAGRALAHEENVAAHLSGTFLTEGQQEAVQTVLLARDRIVGVQGRAGTGKTTMLREVRELAGERPIVGLAPSAAAARVLQRETDIHARTLQWFLTRCQAVDENGAASNDLGKLFGGSVLVLDEASMVSTDQMRSLMRIADKLEVARLVLVGDTRQLRAVEAGQPFRQLQQAGMTTATMDDILRQRNPELRAAVQAVLAGDPGEAVELLGSSVHEVPYEELGEKAAQTWLELDPEVRDRTLLLAPTHALRAEINETVREALAAEGVLRGKTLRIERLVSLGMTRAEKADVRNYRDGDTVVFHQDLVNYRVKKDEVLTVAGIEHDQVNLLHPDGKPRGIRPAGSIRYRLDVYETRPIEIRAGDRIRWTRNDKARTLINGERAEVTAIDRGRVRLRLEDGRTLSLREDDPQLRHIDHAWSSTVHGAQGITADGVIAVLDSSHGALTDQSTFYVEISRARDRAVVLTDNLEQLVEVLEANTGERATAREAIDERIEPDAAEIARLLPEKTPVWTPREEWAALEAQARLEGTTLFLVEGYEALIGRTRKLALLPDLPPAIQEIVDGLLAYDRACRGHDAAAGEFLGLLDAHAVKRDALEEAAEARGSPVAGLEDYPDWRDMAGRLSTNGKALLQDIGDRAGDAGRRISERLEQIPGLLALDDAVQEFETLRREVNGRAEAARTIPFYAEGHDDLVGQARALVPMPGLPAHTSATVAATIADADACEMRRAEIVALRDDAAGLVKERRGLEERARDVPPNELAPPTALDDYAAWSERCKEAAERRQAMLDDPDTWRAHLDRLKDEAREIAADVDRLKELRGHDEAWTKLFDMRRSIVDQVKAGDGIAFYLTGWAAFAEEARSLAQRKGLPEGAAEAAKRVLDYDRSCRAVESFFKGAEQHRERWDALQEETERRAQQNPDVSIVDLPDYLPSLTPSGDFARPARRSSKTTRLTVPFCAGFRRAGRGSAPRWNRLERHGLLDEFVDTMGRLGETERSAVERSISSLDDNACRGATAAAERLAKERELEEAARARLEAELDAQAARAAQWLELLRLFREMEELEREYGELEEHAAHQEVPRTLLPESPAWQERNRTFEEDARWALYDEDLPRSWQSLTDAPERIGEGLERARERQRIPELEADQIAEMVTTELARLRDPDAAHTFSRDWWGQEPLVAGDRIRARQWEGGPGREAVVRLPGQNGGCAPEDVLVLEWVATGPGHEPEEPIQRISSLDLASGSVQRADWSDESLRDVEVARQRPGPAAAFPLDCTRDLAVGDLVRWTEIVEPERDTRLGGRPAGTGRAMVVEVVAELVKRTAGKKEEEDRCKLEERWRSDNQPCGQIELSLGMLMAGGAFRGFWDDEKERDRMAHEQKQELKEAREMMLRPGPEMSMKIG